MNVLTVVPHISLGGRGLCAGSKLRPLLYGCTSEGAVGGLLPRDGVEVAPRPSVHAVQFPLQLLRLLLRFPRSFAGVPQGTLQLPDALLQLPVPLLQRSQALLQLLAALLLLEQRHLDRGAQQLQQREEEAFFIL